MSSRVPSPHALLTVAQQAATEAGKLLLERFALPATGVGSKTTSTDMVSDADRDAEAVLERTLRAARPDDAITGEEGLQAPGTSGLSWLVDPLDGTVNFLYGIPHWCVSVACSDERGALVGVVFDPCRGELFHAVRGEGAWLGGRRLAASDRSDLAESLVATGFAYDASVRSRQAEFAMRVPARVRDLRRFGSAALDLAWVAASRGDGYFETGVQPWDVAAGALLVTEAGGATTFVAGIGTDRRPGIIASNRHIHEQLRELLEIEL